MNYWFAPGPVKRLCCNTAFGLLERKYELARAYLDSPPGQLAVVAAA